MKTRSGFVSNSSSTSFTCEVCSHTGSGMDAGLEDFGFIECAEEHIFCEDHEAKANLSIERMRKEMLSCCIDEEKDKFSQMPDEKITEAFEEFDWDEGGTSSCCKMIEFCPICQLTEIRDKDILAYLFQKFGVNRSQVVAEMQKTYSDHKSFMESVKVE